MGSARGRNDFNQLFAQRRRFTPGRVRPDANRCLVRQWLERSELERGVQISGRLDDESLGRARADTCWRRRQQVAARVPPDGPTSIWRLSCSANRWSEVPSFEHNFADLLACRRSATGVRALNAFGHRWIGAARRIQRVGSSQSGSGSNRRRQ